MPNALATTRLVALDTAVEAAAGAVNRTRAEVALEVFDQVRAMTWRLLHPDS